MYDNLSATSIPSDIHLISSSSLLTPHQQFCQMFGSLADVADVHGAHYYYNQEPHQHLHLQHSPLSQQPCSGQYLANHHSFNYLHERNQSPSQNQNQKIRNTKSSTATSTYQAQHLASRQQQQKSCAQCRNNRSNYHSNSQSAASFQQHWLTIEELKTTRNSCSLCGCNWQEDHVSLDCPECDGYALSRPCPNCDGKCKQIWHRNISATHDRHRALWTGHCALEATAPAASAATPTTDKKQDQPQLEQSQQRHRDHDQQIDLISLRTSHSCDCVVENSAKTTAATTLTGQFNLLAPSSSSLCSSHPSSAASSDDEPDDFLSI